MVRWVEGGGGGMVWKGGKVAGMVHSERRGAGAAALPAVLFYYLESGTSG